MRNKDKEFYSEGNASEYARRLQTIFATFVKEKTPNK